MPQQYLGGVYEGQVLNSPVTLMRFTLTYEGPLSAAGNGAPHKEEKHRIRKALHPQLGQVWRQRPSLNTYLDCYRKRSPTDEWQTSERGRHPSLLPTDHYGSLAQGILIPFPVQRFTFVPLATKKYDFDCDLDILFLRNQPRGMLLDNAGDLDNRLKTLFDALRIPTVSQLPNTIEPAEDEDPFFCLLEDDALISRVRVESERLLDVHRDANHVRLVIRVDLRVHVVRGVTLEFQG